MDRTGNGNVPLHVEMALHADRTIASIDDAGCALLGYTREDLVGKSAQRLNDADLWATHAQARANPGVPYRCVARIPIARGNGIATVDVLVTFDVARTVWRESWAVLEISYERDLSTLPADPAKEKIVDQALELLTLAAKREQDQQTITSMLYNVLEQTNDYLAQLPRPGSVVNVVEVARPDDEKSRGGGSDKRYEREGAFLAGIHAAFDKIRGEWNPKVTVEHVGECMPHKLTPNAVRTYMREQKLLRDASGHNDYSRALRAMYEEYCQQFTSVAAAGFAGCTLLDLLSDGRFDHVIRFADGMRRICCS